jgi:SAM-dependent methyltransferase
MKSKFIKGVLGGAALIFFGLALRKYFFKSWRPYYEEKLYKAPRPLLVKALAFVQDSSQKRVLDLGAGAGNDTAYLLKQGWKVSANDIQEEAIEIIRSRQDIQPYSHSLVLMHKDFNDLPWNEFPQFDLIYAGYSFFPFRF